MLPCQPIELEVPSDEVLRFEVRRQLLDEVPSGAVLLVGQQLDEPLANVGRDVVAGEDVRQRDALAVVVFDGSLACAFRFPFFVGWACSPCSCSTPATTDASVDLIQLSPLGG